MVGTYLITWSFLQCVLKSLNHSRRQQELEGVCASGFEDNPALMSELRALRMRKDELETHLSSLQDSRRHLMVQLEGLMRLLKTHQATSPNSSPRGNKHFFFKLASQFIKHLILDELKHRGAFILLYLYI